LCREIDAADPAAVTPGEKPRRSAEPGADIEHPFASGEAHEVGEPYCRRPLATVKLVDRRQVVQRQTIEVLSGRLQRREDSRPEIGTRVMSFDRVISHFALLSCLIGRPKQ